METDLPNRMMHLPDGEYLLRALAHTDRKNLQDFFYSHNEDTVYQRYGRPIRVMSDEDADHLVGVDQSRDLALALFEVFGQRQIIHAVGRYCLDPDGEHAEVAFVVRESKRRLGFTACLMMEMIRIARGRGLKGLWASVRPSNRPMRKALEKFGFQETTRDSDEVDYSLNFNVQMEGNGNKAESARVRP